MSKVSIISGSPSEQTRLNGVMDFIVKQLEAKGIIPNVINVRNLPAEDLIRANFNSAEILEANRKVEESTILVILTPVYKASFTGVLKTYLDLLPQNAFENKILVPVAIGGTFGHLLMIDYGLKPVLSALGATEILKGAFILDSQVKKLANNQYELDLEAKERLETTLNAFSKKNVGSPVA